ncbi:MAG TPA: DUF302 domain-containing protein [Candidatus Acidoferrum sp.]|nr:DUF302 domain-containing protein [Candidatus Acidoferrum sp.]
MFRLPIHSAPFFLIATLATAALSLAASAQDALAPAVTATSVTHLNYKTSKSFEAVTASIEKQLGKFDPSVGRLFSASPLDGAAIEEKMHAMEGSSGLMIFAVRDHGQLLALKGKHGQARQYEIGNPLVALEMTQHDLRAGEYAPLRMYVYVGEDNLTHVDYDLPSSLFSRFHSKDVDEVGKSLDQKLAKLVANALRD